MADEDYNWEWVIPAKREKGNTITERLKVPGGWLYRTICGNDSESDTVAMVLVPATFVIPCVADLELYTDQLGMIKNLTDLCALCEEALARLMSFYIRHELDEDPDHGGPEDAAQALAERLVVRALREAADWRNAPPL